MSKPYDVGLLVGRFQTFHIGHKSLVENALKICDRVLILVGSSQECGTERNPLNVITRINAIRSVYPDDKQVMIYALADLTNEHDISHEWGEYVMNQVERYIFKKPEVFIFGNDENRGSDWFSDEVLSETSQFIVNRQTIPISATMLRKLMVEDKRAEWNKLVSPELHKLYPVLRDELMTVPFYRNLQKELLSK